MSNTTLINDYLDTLQAFNDTSLSVTHRWALFVKLLRLLKDMDKRIIADDDNAITESDRELLKALGVK